MNELASPIYITREGQRFGPYSLEQCEEMVRAGNLVPSDMAWREGFPDWRQLGEVIPAAPIMNVQPARPVRAGVASSLSTTPQESAGAIIGKMGCGCLLWIGLLVLALGGGVVFPLLLILLPIAVIGGIVDMIRKLVALSKRQ